MGSSSLGYRSDRVHNSDLNPHPIAPHISVATALPAPATAPKAPFLACRALPVLRGIVPTLAYFSVAALVPILFFYASPDFESNVTRGVAIGVAIGAPIAVVFANDATVWYAMALAFHTALEVKVVHVAFDFAMTDGIEQAHMILTIIAAVVIIVHLVPFYLSDRLSMLTLLAAVGVPVNASILVFLSPTTMLLLASSSAMALLAVVLLVIGKLGLAASPLSQLKKVRDGGELLTFAPYAM